MAIAPIYPREPGTSFTTSHMPRLAAVDADALTDDVAGVLRQQAAAAEALPSRRHCLRSMILGWCFRRLWLWSWCLDFSVSFASHF